MLLGLIQYVLGGRNLGTAGLHRRAGRVSCGRGGACSKSATALGRPRARRSSSSPGRRLALGVVNVSAAAGRGGRRLPAARRHGRLLRLAVSRSVVDAGGTRAPLRHRRLLPGRGDLLVGVRAGRIDAQSVRRSQRAGTRSPARRSRPAGSSRSTRSSSSARAGLRVAVADAGVARAREPDQVRVRPHRRRPRLRRSRAGAQWPRATARRSARSGWSPPT